MSRRKLLLNRYELAAHKLISDGARSFGADVFTKVRLADVLRIEHSGLSDEQYTYALKCHFDFVVAKGQYAHFAIEFDGPQHISNPDNIRNDRLKKLICDRLAFPLIRIDSQFLRPVCHNHAVLRWLVEMWFRNQTFSGVACNDSPTTKEYIGFFEFKNGNKTLSDVLSQNALARKSDAPSDFSELLSGIEYDTMRDPFSKYRSFYFTQIADKFNTETSFHNGRDKFGYALSCAVFRIDNKKSLIGRGRTQTSDDWPVCNQSVASDLACVDLHDRIALWLSGEHRVEESNTEALVQSFTAYEETGAVVDPKTFVGFPEFLTSRWL